MWRARRSQTAQDYYSQQYVEQPSTWTDVSLRKPLGFTVCYLAAVYYGRKIMASREPPQNLKHYIVTCGDWPHPRALASASPVSPQPLRILIDYNRSAGAPRAAPFRCREASTAP